METQKTKQTNYGKLIIFLCITYSCLFVIDLSYVWQSTTGSLLMCGVFFKHVCFNSETLYHLALLTLAIIIPLSYFLLLKGGRNSSHA